MGWGAIPGALPQAIIFCACGARYLRDVFIAPMTVWGSVKTGTTIALTIVGITMGTPIPMLFTFLLFYLFTFKLLGRCGRYGLFSQAQADGERGLYQHL